MYTNFNYRDYVDKVVFNEQQVDYICSMCEYMDADPDGNIVEMRRLAYLKVYKNENANKESIARYARKYGADKRLNREIDRLREYKRMAEDQYKKQLDDIRLKVAEEKIYDDASQTEMCRKKWSKIDSVDKLVGIVAKCQSTIEAKEGINPKVADTMRQTIESLNKMLGYNEPEKTAVDNTINVAWGNTSQVLQPPVNAGELQEVSDDKVDAAIVMETAPVSEPTFDDYAG